MAFVAYATVDDIRAYVPTAVDDLWEHDEDKAQDSLRRAAKKINEQLGGMERFTVLPIEEEVGGGYAEILIELNVYEALWVRVSGIYAGEAYDDNWAWIRMRLNNIWGGIEAGDFSFGSEPEAAAGGGVAVHTRRASP
jgi:hypothetical protein